MESLNGVEMESGSAKLQFKSWLSQFRNGSNPWMARYVYGFMFLIANLLAWAVRDYGGNVLTEMERLKGCHGVKDCLGAQGVLRVSLACFMFYFTMFLSTAGASKLKEPRDSWQSGWWSAKIVLWVTFIIIPFLLPAAIIQLYGEIAHFGAGYHSMLLLIPVFIMVFLLIQLISIISFITWLNDCCQSSKSERCQIHIMLLATTAYVLCLTGIILMYIWYAPEPSCLLNIFFITWTLVLLQLMTSVSLHPKVNAGILTPGLMGLYIVFICWFAIRSEPSGESCNKKAEASNKTDWLTIISFVIAVLAMVIATFSTGIDSKCFQFRKDETESEDDVPYGYGFFHFVFATGAMYFAMLLIGWNTHQSMKKFTIDVGWASTWVRIVNEWIAVCVYLWMLVAPIIWKSRQTAESA
ncbi:probable serine incorporator isoform X1 [Prunus dulcis]|uniref:probable serine incorporator isoform X1 n=2 Tax=Prunus dulcis TaxID=3755 RepID=UPI00148232AB|nr:probable serine incorporator isoform X1 [Prunus dulcis]